MRKKEDIFELPEREVDILYVLWNANRPLLASEIAEAQDDLKLATVHTTLKRMLKKGLIEVVDFAKSGNVFGRCYRPTIELKDFELKRFSNDFKKKQCRDITASNLVAALLDDADSDSVLEELNDLEEMIKMQRERIMKRG